MKTFVTADYKPSPQDEEAVIRLLNDYSDARNHRDVDAMAPLFSEDADTRNSVGALRQFKSEIEDLRTMMKYHDDLRAKRTIDSIRFLTPEIALVDGFAQWSGALGNTPSKTMATMILRKEDGKWRIVAVRTAVPATQGFTGNAEKQ